MPELDPDSQHDEPPPWTERLVREIERQDQLGCMASIEVYQSLIVFALSVEIDIIPDPHVTVVNTTMIRLTWVNRHRTLAVDATAGRVTVRTHGEAGTGEFIGLIESRSWVETARGWLNWIFPQYAHGHSPRAIEKEFA